MFKKFKQNTKKFMTGKSGFSLVELIVVIAIMAVMAAVLAPALLGYVERSRAQKDSSALSEVVNSVQLSLADQDVYDEMLKYSAEQYSCYVDSDSPDDANKVDIKVGKYYMYNDNERQLDETVYKLDGVMRGVTITFAPDAAASNSATLDLIKGHVNKYLPSGKKTYGGLTGANASPKLADIADSELYNSLRATIGDKINISSQTYRNSEYTVFISMGTTGGNEAAMQDAIKVWGQFSGTNLPEGSSVAGNTATGSNEFKEPTGSESGSVIIDGATFNDGVTLTWDQLQVEANGAKYGYDSLKISDNEIQDNAFSNCQTIKKIKIPETVNKIGEFAFSCCSSLESVEVPNGVTEIKMGTFSNCTSLVNLALPNTISKIGNYVFFESTAGVNFTFNGTKSDWNSISFGEYWRETCNLETVICTDGNINLN